MKTTLNLDSRIWERVKAAAARQDLTMSALVEAAIRAYLQQKPAPRHLPPLPSFDSGGALTDVANRDELYRLIEGR